MARVFLKKGREKPVLHGHPWIFSGAIGRKDDGIEEGQIVAVSDHLGALIGYGYYNSRTQIALRMLSLGEREVNRDYIKGLITSAIDKRRCAGLFEYASAYRLVYSEGDFLPGLIVDRYENHLVVQVLTLGIERLSKDIVELLIKEINPASIYERSDHSGRTLEGLPKRSGALYGNTPSGIIIREGEMRFRVDVTAGQKTGFFLDQRDGRALVRELSRGRRVVNLFCYTGGFTVAACRGGAREVISVDSSADALGVARENMELNGNTAGVKFVHGDAFHYLRESSDVCDFMIIDPPAFAKTRAGVDKACRGYKDLNLRAVRMCAPGSLMMTCSCSRYIDMGLFQKVVFSAFSDAGRKASILRKLHHPVDHPVSLFHPEGEYLKSMLLYVE